MDLTRLYNLTTPELREEAERLGVADTYAMSRGQLIHAIRGKAGTRRQDGFLGKVFGFAKWAIHAAGETKTGESAPESEPAAAPLPVTAPLPLPVTAPESEPASAAEPASAPASVPAAVSEAVWVTDDESEPETVFESEIESVTGSVPAPQSVSETAIPIETTTQTGPPSRPPAGVFSNSAGLFEEPFPTRTMARILAEQGHYKRSLAIYARLLHEEPGDGELSAEADAVRAEARARRSHTHP